MFFIVGMLTLSTNARWSQNGVIVAGGNGYGNATNHLWYPYGLDIDDDNQSIVIADWWNDRIVEWKIGASHGKIIAGGGGQGNRLDQLYYPTDVLIDKETNSLFIADRWNNRVVRWSRRHDTTHGEVIVDNISCFGLAIDHQRHLYVSDYVTNEIRRYTIGDKNSMVVAGGNGNGNQLNQLNYPTYLFVDEEQTVYVMVRARVRVRMRVRVDEVGARMMLNFIGTYFWGIASSRSMAIFFASGISMGSSTNCEIEINT